MLFVWDTAITQTGGYFYSRLLLAVINAAGLLIVLVIFNVPFAAPLAIFCGVVSAFIPIVGTYIGGLFPVLVAFLTSTGAGIAVILYIVDLPADRELLPEPADSPRRRCRCTRRSRSARR